MSEYDLMRNMYCRHGVNTQERACVRCSDTAELEKQLATAIERVDKLEAELNEWRESCVRLHLRDAALSHDEESKLAAAIERAEKADHAEDFALDQLDKACREIKSLKSALFEARDGLRNLVEWHLTLSAAPTYKDTVVEIMEQCVSKAKEAISKIDSILDSANTTMPDSTHGANPSSERGEESK